MAILRVDYQVQDTQGRALSGALVYFCSQPATVINPPSPLATVYGNTTGSIVAANPQIADQYGHVGIYLSNTQLYTVVFIHPLIGILSYPDQSAGSSSTSINATSATPAGAINSVNTIYTLPSVPTYPAFLMLNLNGVTLTQGLGYTFSGATITMASPPQTGDTLYAYYI